MLLDKLDIGSLYEQEAAYFQLDKVCHVIKELVADWFASGNVDQDNILAIDLMFTLNLS